MLLYNKIHNWNNASQDIKNETVGEKNSITYIKKGTFLLYMRWPNDR